MSARLNAAKILIRVLLDRVSLTYALEEKLPSTPKQEQRLVKECCFGVCRFHTRLSSIANQLLHTSLKDRDQDIFILLLLGLYQILYLRVPEHAAVSETVEVARVFKKSWACSLLNGALRNFLRQKNILLEAIEKYEPAHYAHPAWLIQDIKKAWPDNWPSILTTNNTQAPMSLRVNAQKQTRNDYLQALRSANLEARALDAAPHAIQLDQPVNVDHLPGFSEGDVSVQDLSSQCVIPLLQLKPNLRVLDACAAPGGKTCAMLESEPTLEVTSVDSDNIRMNRLRENLLRLGLEANCKVSNLEHAEEWWDDMLFDRILLDAPCSATGVIRRHPDIKILRHRRDIETLAQQQLHLLHKVWETLKSGGRLIYTTCSILPEENENVIQQFLIQQESASLEPIELSIGSARPFGWQCLPEENGHDGFFYACLINN